MKHLPGLYPSNYSQGKAAVSRGEWFRNMILNLNVEDTHNIICSEKLTIMEDHNMSDDCEKNYQPLQECVDKNV